MPCISRADRLRSLLYDIVCVIAVAVLGLARPSLAQTSMNLAPMKLASATINDVQYEWQKTFAKNLHMRIADLISTEIYPASQFGSIPQMVDGVVTGTLELFTTPTSFLVSTDPRFEIFEAPGLFDSPQHLRAVLQQPEYRQHVEELALDKGLRVVGVFYNSPLILNTNKPIKSLDQIAGLTVRTFASPLQTEPMKALDANPLPLALSQVVPALQAGTIDGLLAGMPILTAFKYYDVANYVLDLEFAYVVSVSVVNEAWFQAQSEDVKTAILEAGREAEQSVFAWGVTNVENSQHIWIEKEGEIFPLSAVERARMMDVFERISDDILSQNAVVEAEYARLKRLVSELRE